MKQVAEIALLRENIGQRITTEYGQKRTKRLVQHAGEAAGRRNDAFAAFDEVSEQPVTAADGTDERDEGSCEQHPMHPLHPRKILRGPCRTCHSAVEE